MPKSLPLCCPLPWKCSYYHWQAEWIPILSMSLCEQFGEWSGVKWVGAGRAGAMWGRVESSSFLPACSPLMIR